MFKKILIFTFLILSAQGFSQDLLMQDGTFNQCSGMFLDSGGTGNYSSNEDFTITICPENPGDSVSINFTDFNSQDGIDVLSVFDGDDTTAPPLGMFSGTNNPGLIEPSVSNTSGCLTFTWVTNGSGNTTGWEADLSCFTPCQNIVANLDSTMPAAGTGNTITADEDEVITFNGSGTFSNDGTGATYLWDFGDGTTAMGQSVTHAYTAPGLYSVTLTITDTAGCSNENNIELSTIIGSTNPGNPNVDAGEDVDLQCDTPCTTLSASFLEIGDTSTYTVNSIPYVPPFSFSGLTNSVNTNIDDAWDDVEDLPFEFCFFNDIETQFQVGSNGLIRFDVSATDTSNAWNLQNDALPNNTNPALGEGNVFSPVHDINPASSSGEEIAWEIIGTAPNRVLAVSFFNVEMFNCSSAIATHMAVFYETTNVIDIYIENAPFCASFNNNKAVGIQNDAGTEAFVPPGRNTNEGGGWTASDEAWRFQPAGPSIVEFAWLDDMGNVLSTNASYEVCPTDPSTTYTARVTYTNCNGDITIVTDDVTVTTNIPFVLDIGDDVNLCEGDADVVLDADIGSGTADYQWTLDGTDIMGETNPTLTVTSPNSGTYAVTVIDQGCTSIDEVEINYAPIPVVNAVADQAVCDDDNDGFWEFDFTALDATAIGAQTDVMVSYHNSLADAENNANPIIGLYTNMAAFTAETIFIRIDSDANDMCFATGQFLIDVSSGPIANPVDDQLICDDNNDGFWDFDLDALRATVLGTQAAADYTISFHASQADADADANPLPDLYTNQVAYTEETLFVRIEDNTVADCFNTTSFLIDVFDVPTANMVDDQLVCDDDNDGFSEFDFTLLDATVLGTQPDADFDVTYYNSLADAQSGMNAIVGLYTNAAAYTAEIIFVRIENIGNPLCFATTDFEIDVINSPVANPVDDQLICDDDNDGFWDFDLDALRATILGAQPMADFNITFHNSMADADADANPLPDTYTNQTAYTAETIFVRIDSNSGTDCYATTDFVIDVFEVPTANTVNDQLVCDDDNDGFSEFDFTLLDATVLGTQPDADFDVTYYNILADAQSGMNAIAGLYTNAAAYTAETIFVRIENSGNPLCFATTDFDINVENSPVANPVNDQLICDDNNDGFWDFDLDALRATIIGAQPMADFNITFHNSMADADADANPLPDTYTNQTAYTAETIFVRVDSNSGTDCYATTDFIINVFEVPTANTVDDQLVCDDDNDGFSAFDFTLLDAIVLGTQAAADFEVSYHNTLADAQNGMAPIVGDYTNMTAYTAETIFVRIENRGNELCADSTTNFTINVFNTPTANTVDDQLICDDNNDGIWAFDLDALRPIVLGTQTIADFTITFHNSMADADSNANALPDTYQNMAAYTAETIFVRIENNANTDCYNTTDFEIDVFDVPTANAVNDQLVCDDNNDGLSNFDFTLLDATVLGTQLAADFEVSYHNSLADAQMDINPIVGLYENATAYTAETIYVRLENRENQPCADTAISFDINVFDTPVANTVDDQLICDDNNDGLWDFDLDALRTTVLGIQATADFNITFHNSLADADANANSLADTYQNMTAYTAETIFVRIENNNNTTCYSTSDFEIDVFNSATAEDVDDQLICDADNDGFFEFDLNALRPSILGTQSNTEFDVSFHASQANADAGTNPLPDNYTNQTAFTAETIFVRLENTENTNCDDTTVSFVINVFATPQANMVDDILICDTDNDGFFDFDLDAERATVLGTQSTADFTVSFHASQTDADADANPLPDSYTNMVAYVAETIFVRVENNGNDTCIDTATSFEIDVFNGGTANQIDDQPVCDEDGDGFEIFDLDDLRDDALGTQSPADYSVTFHNSQAEADTGANPLPDNYQNMTAFTAETIFVRVETTGTICFATSQFDIIVNRLPEDNVVIEDFFACENNTDFIAEFDLESKNAEILAGQDSAIYMVTYHETQQDADDLTNPLPSPYTNTMSPQPIFVAITNTLTDCSVSTQSFNIEVLDGAEAADDFYEECDEVGDNDGSTQFDLSTRETLILDGQDPNEREISFHFSFDDAFDNVNELPFLYENLTNPQIIYARVSNNINPEECFEVSEVTLQVNLRPELDLDESYTLCITSNNEAVVPIPPVIDTFLDDADYDFEWSFNGDIIPTETSSSLTPTQGGTYSVVVTDTSTSTVTMCVSTDTTEVMEGGIPDTFDVEVTSQTFTGNNMIIATATGNSEYEFSLDNGAWQLSGEFEDVTGGDHIVSVRDVLGCGVLSQTITVIDYAKFFTPNGDGNNDTWTIKGIDSQPGAVIYIHDRYGKLLKQLSPTSPGWDGTYNGNKMPSSDYWFTLEYTEPINDEKRTFTAHFALKR